MFQGTRATLASAWCVILATLLGIMECLSAAIIHIGYFWPDAVNYARIQWALMALSHLLLLLTILIALKVFCILTERHVIFTIYFTHIIRCIKDDTNLIFQEELRICVLPTHLSYDAPWPVRKVPLRCTPHFVTYHLESKTYCVITSAAEPLKSYYRFNGEDKVFMNLFYFFQFSKIFIK